MPLILRDDGTVVVTVKGEPIVLGEPGIREVAEMHKLISEADATLPAVDPNDMDGSTQARREAIYFAEVPPYAVVFQRIISMLTGRDLSLDDLPAWSKNPQTVASMVVHWQDPLPG